jgi:hypothetical protein
MQPNGSTGPSNMSQSMVIEDGDRENEAPCVGVGVVRIHSFCLKLKTILRDRYWKTADHQNNGHIRLNYPVETCRSLDSDLKVFGQTLNRERKMFQGLAQSKVIDIMLANAAKLGMTYRTVGAEVEVIRTFTQLCTAWKQDNVSSKMQEDMNSVCVGCFEKNWDQKMELELMKSFDMTYNAPTSGRMKGCLSILCSYERSKLIKRINKRAGVKRKEEGNEGNKIRVTRTSKERKESGEARKKPRHFLTPLEVSQFQPKVMPPYYWPF